MISAIVLAAGQSRRMGQPKMLLPWGGATILGQVIATMAAAGIADILVVSGGARQEVENLIQGLAKQFPVRSIHNPAYAQSEMLGSIQVGLRAQDARAEAALIALGDQPQVREGTVKNIIEAYEKSRAGLVIPSYNQRRGHPWLAARRLWTSLLGLTFQQTPRDFLNAHAAEILYISAADDSVLRDVDTPKQYETERPKEAS
jgi:molybdenum cofactor cytidylyltransferase